MKQLMTMICMAACLLAGCAHQELEAPCTFQDRSACGQKLTLDPVIL